MAAAAASGIARYGVLGAPTLIVFKEGAHVLTLVGRGPRRGWSRRSQP
jgi:hypothetical protein